MTSTLPALQMLQVVVVKRYYFTFPDGSPNRRRFVALEGSRSDTAARADFLFGRWQWSQQYSQSQWQLQGRTIADAFGLTEMDTEVLERRKAHA